jgi:hypothetical protein
MVSQTLDRSLSPTRSSLFTFRKFHIYYGKAALISSAAFCCKLYRN